MDSTDSIKPTISWSEAVIGYGYVMWVEYIFPEMMMPTNEGTIQKPINKYYPRVVERYVHIGNDKVALLEFANMKYLPKT